MRFKNRLYQIARSALLIALIAFLMPAASSRAASERPFGLPFSTPPGPATWLVGQQYGNTTGAYNLGKYWYAAGQGFHFGVDFSTPCQTPLVALADGIVDEVDNLSHGSAPHNLTIRHTALGYNVFYGHLFAKPTVTRGQPVKRGQPVALSGDPDGTCESRPHLHLEIRSLDYGTAYDPAQLIDADWATLSTIGSYSPGMFAKDLYNPNRWQTIADQPTVKFGGNLYNGYRAVWPSPARNALPPATLTAFDAPPVPAAVSFRRLTGPGCCSEAWWAPDGQSVRFWNNAAEGQSVANTLATIHAVDLSGSSAPVALPSLPILSPDGRYALQTSDAQIAVRRLADQTVWPLATGSAWPRFSPDSTHILWQHFPSDAVPGSAIPLTDVWIANMDGSARQHIGTQPGGSVAWLDADRLLLTLREGQTNLSTLIIYTISTRQIATLASIVNLRSVSIAPGGAMLLYLAPFQKDPAASGLYALNTQPGAQPIKLPFFGSWRWRDSHSLIYIPFAPGTPPVFTLYDVRSGTARSLTSQPFSILNGDWSIAPDGRNGVFWNGTDQALWAFTLAG